MQYLVKDYIEGKKEAIELVKRIIKGRLKKAKIYPSEDMVQSCHLYILKILKDTKEPRSLEALSNRGMTQIIWRYYNGQQKEELFLQTEPLQVRDEQGLDWVEINDFLTRLNSTEQNAVRKRLSKEALTDTERKALERLRKKIKSGLVTF